MADAFYYRGLVYLAQEKNAEAAADLAKYVELAPHGEYADQAGSSWSTSRRSEPRLPRRLDLPAPAGRGGNLGAAGCGRDTEREPGPGASAPTASGAARDVLLITVDTLRADATGFGGNPRVATPALDRLAAAGRVFTRAHAHNVVTLPSHANILTGRLPFEHGIRDNSGFVLPAAVPTAGEYFKHAGFATAAVVGAFPLDARFGLARGFDLYDDRYPEGSEVEGFRLVERRGDEVVAAGSRVVAPPRRGASLPLGAPVRPPRPLRATRAVRLALRRRPLPGRGGRRGLVPRTAARRGPRGPGRRPSSSSPPTTASRSASTASSPTACSPTRRPSTCPWWYAPPGWRPARSRPPRGTSTSCPRSWTAPGSRCRPTCPAARSSAWTPRTPPGAPPTSRP